MTLASNCIVDVATAIPAFVGYTEKAVAHGKLVTGVPVRLSSMAEFQLAFGAGPVEVGAVQFELVRINAAGTTTAQPFVLTQTGGIYGLHSAMVQFFQNGGGACYVVSVGNYDRAPGFYIGKDALIGGIRALEKEHEPTLLVVPEAVRLAPADCAAVQAEMLRHCGGQMKNRFAILDVLEAGIDLSSHAAVDDCIAEFRASLDPSLNRFLSYGAAYFPWLHTSVVAWEEVKLDMIAPQSRAALLDCIKAESVAQAIPATALEDEFRAISSGDAERTAAASKALSHASPLVRSVLDEMQRRLNLLPPSATMAGLYAMVDSTRGVWKAPANVSLSGVTAPSVAITHEQQEGLHISPGGKSINAIRAFVGEGVLVWGARTLDGNSLDWRYVNVRRTVLMLEESLRMTLQSFVFEPNVAATWSTIRAVCTDFLTHVWKRGGLAGAVPEDAFLVHTGLGETMTPEDVTEGLLKLTLLVALSRPAEFIEITVVQQMQKG